MDEEKALMNRHLRGLALHGLEENVEEVFRPDRWLVYKRYEIIFDDAQNRYIQASSNTKSSPDEIRDRLHPLARTSADLFLRFAHWPEEKGMDKELDTERNAEAALSWAQEFGVLGLNPVSRTVSMLGLDFDITISDIVNSRRVTADYLEKPWLGDAGMGRRNSPLGGRPEESVANFAFEA